MTVPGFGLPGPPKLNFVERTLIAIAELGVKKDEGMLAKVHEIGTPDATSRTNLSSEKTSSKSNDADRGATPSNVAPCGHSIWQDCDCMESTVLH